MQLLSSLSQDESQAADRAFRSLACIFSTSPDRPLTAAAAAVSQVKLVLEQSDEDLAFLMGHDSDRFDVRKPWRNRRREWSGAGRLAASVPLLSPLVLCLMVSLEQV